MPNEQLTSFNDFVREKFVIIPTNQRGYAWQPENFVQLIQDVKRLPERYVHYAGPILFLQRDAEVFHPSHSRITPVTIEDGQQRSTTLFLLARILLDYFKRRMSGEYNRIRELELTLFQLNGEQSIRRLKSENSSFDNLLLSLLERSGQDLPELVSASMRRLNNMYRHIQTYVENLDEDEVRVLFENIFVRLRFVAIDLKHERVNASIAFHTTNSRGVPLKAFDIVKNHLMYFVEQRNEKLSELADVQLNPVFNFSKSEVERCWFNTITLLEKNKLGDNEDEFLIFAFRVFENSNAAIKKNQIAGKIEACFPDNDLDEVHPLTETGLEDVLKEVKRFTDLWISLAEHYSEILNKSKLLAIYANPGEWVDWAHSILKIHALNKKGIFNELLTCCRVKFSPVDNTTIAKLCYLAVFRVFAIQKGRRVDHHGGEIRTLVNEVFGGRKDAREVQEFLVRIILRSGDLGDCVRALFGENAITYASKSTELGWFLTEYEYHLCNISGTLPARFDRGTKTIEHILPQHSGGEEHMTYYQLKQSWKDAWQEEEYRAFKHRIGNLVMTNHNSVLGAKSYEKKCRDEGYCYSAVESSKSEKELVEKYPTWNLENMRKRELVLLQFFLDEFSIEQPKEKEGVKAPKSLSENTLVAHALSERQEQQLTYYGVDLTDDTESDTDSEMESASE